MKIIWKILIVFGIGAIFAVLIMWGNGAFAEAEQKELMKKFCDAFFVPGVVLCGFGLLTFASNGGVFDMLAYGVQSFFGLFRRDLSKRKYKDFYEYKKSKEGKKQSFTFLLLGGLAHVVISILFLILYYNV